MKNVTVSLYEKNNYIKELFEKLFIQGASKLCVKNIKEDKNYLNKQISYNNVASEMQRWEIQGR